MVWQLNVLLFRLVTIGAVQCSAGQAFGIIIIIVVVFVVVDIRLVVIADPTSARAAGQIATAIFAVESSFVCVDGGKVVSGVDGRGRVGDEVVAQVGEGAFHDREDGAGTGRWRPVRSENERVVAQIGGCRGV